MERTQGNIKNFNRLWRGRTHKRTNWFYRGEPQNQIQYAFGQHFDFLKSVVPIKKNDRVLEVGCGRGSFGAFFADYGCRVMLIDLSEGILKEAQEIFRRLKLDQRTEFLVSDALNLTLPEETFDLTTSIGLLEHFEDPTDVIREQIRVLKKGGFFTAYVVPAKMTMTKVIEPINRVLKNWQTAFMHNCKLQAKTRLFRTKYDSAFYLRIMQGVGLKKIGSAAVYPYPAVSYSPEFPFSLMPPDFEKALVKVFQQLEMLRRQEYPKRHPWVCEESIAQGFFIWGRKS